MFQLTTYIYCKTLYFNLLHEKLNNFLNVVFDWQTFLKLSEKSQNLPISSARCGTGRLLNQSILRASMRKSIIFVNNAIIGAKGKAAANNWKGK